MSTLIDLATHAAQLWPTKGITAEHWEQALTGRDPDLARAVLGELKQSAAEHVRPQDFAAAYRRRAPQQTCDRCANAGQIWDGESFEPDGRTPRYTFCSCAEGERMRQLNERLARESESLRPVWMRGTTEGMRARHLEVVE